ncbi:MAG: inositol monophosphatase family protein [Aureliella sp.]
MPNPPITAPKHLLSLDSSTLQVAAKAALAGSQIVLDYFERGVSMRSKDDEASYNLVSDADVKSEQAIAHSIRSAFPTHEIAGEEENVGDVTAEDVWVIDPLDGTNNFAHNIPHFAVCIGYYHREAATSAVVVNPVRGDWYYAVRGGGAFHNGQPLGVSNAKSLDEVMVGCGFYYDRGEMMRATLATVEAFFEQQIHGIRRFGTAALDLCQVASGQFGAFFEYQLAAWDFAAARLILEEAGGTITDARGQPLKLQTSSILASNTHLHAAALSITERFHP